MLKTYTTFDELIYRLFDIVDPKIEYRKGCRSMVRLGIDEYLGAVRDV